MPFKIFECTLAGPPIDFCLGETFATEKEAEDYIDEFISDANDASGDIGLAYTRDDFVIAEEETPEEHALRINNS